MPEREREGYSLARSVWFHGGISSLPPNQRQPFLFILLSVTFQGQIRLDVSIVAHPKHTRGGGDQVSLMNFQEICFWYSIEPNDFHIETVSKNNRVVNETLPTFVIKINVHVI